MLAFKSYVFAFVITVTLQDNPVSAVYETITLPPNEAFIIRLPAEGMVVLRAVNISHPTAYIICQAHSQIGNVTLSMGPDISFNESVTGRDVGVVSVIKGSTEWAWYLYSNHTINHNVLVHTTYLTGKEPLPGGCNEESDLKNDPNLHLGVTPTKATLLFQWANSGTTPSGSLPVCEDKTYQSYLYYHSYVLYLGARQYSEKAYFDALEKMLLVRDVREHGVELTGMANTPSTKSLYTISSYARQGVVYSVVVKEHNADTGVHAYAAYIPVVEYGCDIEDADACTHTDVAAIILATVGGIVGILLTFLGHRWFKTENFIFGFVIFALIFYQLFGLTTDMSLPAILALSAILGLIGGSLLLGLWWYVGFPILNVLFIGLLVGYLVACILFYTPFANLTVWVSPFNYGMTFACTTLVVPVLMLLFTRTLNILCCAVIGSYGIIVAIDTYLGSGMRYLVLNSLRHGTDRHYVDVIVTGPYTKDEWILTALWVVLATGGFTFQAVREHKKAPFPPCPRQQRNRDRDLRIVIRSNVSDEEPLIREDVYRQAIGDNSRLARGDNYGQTMGDHSRLARGDNSRQTMGANSRQTMGDNPRQTMGDNSRQTMGDHSRQTAGDNSRQPLLTGDNMRRYGTHNALVVKTSPANNEAI